MTSLVALAMVFVSLGGCMGSSGGPGEDSVDSEEHREPGEIIFNYGNRPVVFNDTINPGEFYFILDEPRDPCEPDWPYPPTFSYKIYDRQGQIGFNHIELEKIDHSRTIVNVTFDGDPPFLIATDKSFCLGFIRVGGISDGFNPKPIGEHNPYTDIELSVSIPAGEQQTIARWTPNSNIHKIAQAWPMDRKGNQYGYIALRDPHGGMAHESEFRIVGGNDQAYGITVFVEGTYELELNLSTPAFEDTKWTYVVQVRQFTEDICDLDFEWNMCG